MARLLDFLALTLTLALTLNGLFPPPSSAKVIPSVRPNR